MHLTLKVTNRRRLASLSALGAGALGVAAVPANANDVVFPGVLDVPAPYYTLVGPNGAGGAFSISSCIVTCFSFWHDTYIVSKPGKYGTAFRVLATGARNSWVVGQPQGAVWGTAPGKSTKSADITGTYDGAVLPTLFTSTDRYMLFRFEGGALKHAMYGWARLSINKYNGVGLVDWAYDPSGVHIPAGYHGDGAAEPEEIGAAEPSAIDSTGLRALGLGAVGLRR